MSLVSDTHGGVSTITRISNIKRNNPGFEDGELGVIILGDAGLNFYLNKTDKKHKKMLNNMGVKIYCVRGNHEQRPELIPGMHLENDFQVGNMTWMEEEFPNIRYFADGGNYVIDGHPTLVIGGAYSVDKYWRLIRAGYTKHDGNIADPKKCGWFKDECLTQEEMEPKIHIDVPMPMDYVSMDWIREFEILAPFGKDNTKPVFADKNLRISRMWIIGKNQNVLRLSLKTENGSPLSAIYFGDIEKMLSYMKNKFGESEVEAAFVGRENQIRMAFVYYPKINVFREMENIQFEIQNYQ